MGRMGLLRWQERTVFVWVRHRQTVGTRERSAESQYPLGGRGPTEEPGASGDRMEAHGIGALDAGRDLLDSTGQRNSLLTNRLVNYILVIGMGV